MGIFDFLFGNRKKQIQEFVDKGAIILDVRTKSEWDNGHIKNAKHIPLNDLQNHIGKLTKMKKPVITCCASGARSGQARSDSGGHAGDFADLAARPQLHAPGHDHRR